MNFGSDGRLIQMQLDEMIGDLEKEELYIIKDYIVKSRKKKTAEDVIVKLREMMYEDLSKEIYIVKLLRI